MAEALGRLRYLINGAAGDTFSDDIAAALLDLFADIDRRLLALETPAYVGPVGPGGSVEECTAHTCSYYVHYLAYGPPDLLHEGYHAAEDRYFQHSERCKVWDRGSMCSVCTSYEKRVRAV